LKTFFVGKLTAEAWSPAPDGRVSQMGARNPETETELMNDVADAIVLFNTLK